MDYIAQWRYSSSYGGPYVEGEIVQINEELAALINRDSPGVLVLKSDTEKKKPVQREQKPVSNRQQKKSGSR